MFLYLLLAAAGLFVLAKVASSSRGAGDRGPGDVPFRALLSGKDRIDALSGKLDMVITSENRARRLALEKYADSIFFCNNEPWTIINVPVVSFGDDYEYRFTTEAEHAKSLSYLEGTKPEAAARVAVMRAYIESRASVPGAPLLRALERASFKTMQEYGMSLVLNVYEKGNTEALAHGLGIPLSDVRAQGEKLMRAAGIPGPAGATAVVETLLREVKPAVAALNESISGFSKKISSYATERSSEAASAFSALSKFGAAIPAVGAVVQFWMSTYSAGEAEYRKSMAETCQQAISGIDVIVKDLVDSHFPVSLRAFDMSCGDPNVRVQHGDDFYWMAPNQYVAFNAYFRILHGLEALSIAHRAFISRWWATALTFMSNPRVHDVFRAMGERWDFASDEQVMLVAAPFAVSNDITVDVFAKILWDRCPGYQDAPAAILDVKETTTGCFVARRAAFVQIGMLAEEALKMITDPLLVAKMREESRPHLKEALSFTLPT